MPTFRSKRNMFRSQTPYIYSSWLQSRIRYSLHICTLLCCWIWFFDLVSLFFYIYSFQSDNSALYTNSIDSRT